jgi:transketolase
VPEKIAQLLIPKSPSGATVCAATRRTFGESAPLQKLVKKFGFTVDAVVAAAIEQSNRAKG